MDTYQQQYYQLNRNKRKLDLREWNQKIRETIIRMLGGKCIKCNFTDPRALQMDHINGGGTKEMKVNTRNKNKYVLDSLLNKEGKYQLLCANCNWIKKVENKEIRF